MKRAPDEGFITLTQVEKDLVEYASSDDSFIQNGYRLYGDDWMNHVPTKVNAAMQYFFNLVLLPKQLAAYYCPIGDVMIHGARFCIGPGTRLLNADTGKSVPVEEIDGPFPVWSLARGEVVRALASKPFVRGYAQLYKVSFANGRSIVVAGKHSFLTRSGWRPLRSLSPGDEVVSGEPSQHQQESDVFRLLSSSALSQLARPLGGWRCREIVGGCQDRCVMYPCQYDVQLPVVQESAPVFSPLPVGVRAHTPRDLRGGVQADRVSDISLSQCVARLSIDDISHGSSSPYFLFSGYQDESLCGARFLWQRQGLFPSRLFPSSGFQLDTEPVLPRLETLCEPCFPPSNNIVLDFVPIVKIEPCGYDHYYGLTVPNYGNYLAEGVFNLNSGKTVALACANAMWAAFNPGNNWLHVSPSLEQSAVSFHKILEHGQAGKFRKVFIRHYREAPSPTMFYKRWDKYDPGSEVQFRSIGQNPMELLRSFEAGRVTADEAFRTQTSDGPYRVLAGMLRGPNSYNLNRKPDLKKKYDDLAMGVATETNPLKRVALQNSMDMFAEDHGLSKDTRMMLFGNVGAFTWEWERFLWGQRHPSKRWAVTWTSADNPYVTERQRELVRMQYKDDPDGLSMEMEATRPRASGDVFTSDHMRGLLDGELDKEAIEAIGTNVRGWIWDMHEDYGLTRYAKPYEKGAVYAAGADPGTGRVPRRNKWVNFVVRIEPRPIEVVYMCTGNIKRKDQGSIDPWIADAKYILKHYPVPEGHFAAEAGGTQKNVHRVVWPDNLYIVPLNMAQKKVQLILQAQLMLRREIFISPNIAMWEREMLSYQFADRKIEQDFVMAFLSVIHVVWPHVSDEFDIDPIDEDEDFWDWQEYNRDTRDYGREVRTR